MPFVKQLSAKGKKVTIIENEIGEIGVDDLYLKENGLHMKEIYHGCICCNLRTNLISSLIELERDYKPEVIVMEPTGVADPYLILSSLSGYPGYVESKTMVSIVDAERFEDIVDLKIPLAIDGVKSADLIALNKDEICLSELETKKYFEDKIYKIALLLNEAGADLIGNLKLIIKSDKDGYLLISTTSFTRYAEVTGKLPAGYSKVIFNMNAMVYGIEKKSLDSIVNQVFPY
jgi:G3E family GTPase